MISSEAPAGTRSLPEDATGNDAPAERAAVIQFRSWTARIVCVDAVAMALASGVVLLARFGGASNAGPGGGYRVLAAILVPAWLVMMTLAGTYDSDYYAGGPEQYRRVLNGGVWLLALLAFASFALRADVSRAFVLVSIPQATLFTLTGRYASRKALQRRFARCWTAHRAIAIGSPSEIIDLAAHLHRSSNSGYQVVAALTPGEHSRPALPHDVAWVGSDIGAVIRLAAAFGADTLAVAGTHAFARGDLRRLSWQLEGIALDLVVVPSMTDVAGPRVRIRPVEGLPLLHVDKPQFSGRRRAAKNALDRMTAAVLGLILLPVWLVAALGVRFTSRGPVLFRHTRVGKDGQLFSLLKFRTMYDGATGSFSLSDHVYGDPSLPYKSRRDPRVTRVGAFLRRFSIDEIPQLWNVLIGQMSLVGPRPLVPAEINDRGGDVHRRLLVKPGITGLWQVSGRSEVSWEERMRLDLDYVDHWSVGLDLVLMGKTLMTVIRGRGAY